MNIYKRAGSLILSLLLVFSLLSSTLAVQTYAATAPALSAESKSVSAGEQFTVAVNLANATSVYGGNFTLQYDSNLLTADSYTFGSIVGSHTKNCNLDYQSAGNLIRFTFSGASALTSSGTLITFTFTAKQIVSGSAALQFTAYKMYDENGNAITSTASSATITISSKPVVSPSISITNKTATVGETVSVPVMISNSSDVYGGNFTLQYDSSLLTAESYSFGSIVSGHTKNCNLYYQSAGNLIRVTFSGADAVSSDGTLVIFTFTAKATGTATLEFTAYKMYDENGSSIATTISNGNVTVESKPTKTLTSISIQSNPTKTTYYIGDSLNTSGLQLNLTYSDGSNETVTSGYTTSGFSSSSTGTKTVTVSYDGKTTTFTVTVNTPLISLSSASKSMTVGDTATLTATTTPSGQTVTWTSSNTSVATVSGGTIIAKASGSATITAKFTYNGITYSKTCSVTVVNPAPTLSSISVQTNPTKTTYYIGDSLNTSGLVLLLTYSDGSTETVTSGFTTSGFSSTYAGTKTVTVSYESFTDTFDVTIHTPSISFNQYETDDMIGLYLGVPKTFEVTTTPSNQDVSFWMVDPEYFSVSGNTITATKSAMGITTLVAEFTYNDIKYTNTLIVSVIDCYECYLGSDRVGHLDFKTGTLSIQGTGDMPNYADFGEAPWSNEAEYVNKIQICEGITSIGDYAFVNCINAKEVEIANTVKSIGTWAFEDCWAVETLIVPESVEKIDDYAFTWCGGLKDIYIYNDDVVLGKNALNCEYSNATIHGYKNSTAEAHAAQYGRTFKTFPPTSMTISKSPFKKSYYVGESINVDGLQLTLTYGNGYTEIFRKKLLHLMWMHGCFLVAKRKRLLWIRKTMFFPLLTIAF